MEKSKFTLTAANLKWIAIILMFINHFCYRMNVYAGVQGYFFQEMHWYISRPAFIIFAYQIAEGMYYTKNRKKYIISLFVFAFVSEIIYDICFFEEPFYFSDQNVFFNLGLSALTIAIIDKLGRKPIIIVSITILSMIVALLINANYLMTAEALIVAFYYLRDNKKKQLLVSAMLFVTVNFTDYVFRFALDGLSIIEALNYRGLWINYFLELHGLLAWPLFILYKGEKGKNINKWFFYLFYPCHLLLIYLISLLFIG